MSLSVAQRAVLEVAAQHATNLAIAPERLSAGARNAVFRSLLNAGLLEGEDGAWTALRITEAGLQSIGIEPAEDARPRDERNGVDPRLVHGDNDEDIGPASGVPALELMVVPANAEPRSGLRAAAQRVWSMPGNPEVQPGGGG